MSKHRADVSHQDMEEINSLQSIQDLERFLSFFPPSRPFNRHAHALLTYQVASLLLCDSVLCRVFGIDLPDERKAILLELYVQTVLFCRERAFKSEQTSALLSIIRSIHEANVGKQSQTAPQFETKQAFHINDKNKL